MLDPYKWVPWDQNSPAHVVDDRITGPNGLDVPFIANPLAAQRLVAELNKLANELHNFQALTVSAVQALVALGDPE